MKSLLFLLLGASFASCAVICHGTHQDVSFSSTPSAAHLYIDGADRGLTPAIFSLERWKNHTVRLQLDGYKPYELSLNRKVDGLIAGNIIFGGLIGIVVDVATGAMYKLTPKAVLTELQTSASTAQAAGKDGFQILVTLHRDPSWEKIGQLTPIQP